MKILHVHGRDYPHVGGTVSLCRLHAGLQQAGIDSRILCHHKTLASSVQIPRTPRLESLLKRVTSRLSLNDVHCVGAFKIKDCEAYTEADILNIHGIHGGFFSYLALPALTAHKPTVYTIRDMWPFTGHCAVSYDCERWQIGCGKCPYPEAPPPLPSKRDNTHLEWKLKNWVYKRSHFTLVTLSRRMTEQVKHSMLQRFPVYQIPNGIDTEAYQPLDRELCRSLLDIPPRKNVLLFAAANVSRRNKGGDVLIKALNSLPQSLRHEIVLLLLGEGGGAIAEAVDLPCHVLGFVGDQRLKAVVYSATDVFVFPTRAESFGNVILESMACGTPVVSFDVGGVPDLVRPGINGYLAELENVQAFSEGIIELLEDEALRRTMGQQGRAIAVKEFSVELEVQRYIDLYNQLLHKSAT